MQLIFLQLIIFASLMQMACIAFAQERRAVLSGTVRAAEDGQPLQDVLVRVVGIKRLCLDRCQRVLPIRALAPN
jgi:hypothetical protein